MTKEKPTSPDVTRENYESAEKERTEAQLEHYGEVSVDIAQKLDDEYAKTQEAPEQNGENYINNSSLNEQQKQAIEYLLNSYNNESGDFDRAIEVFKEKSKDLWSRDYALRIVEDFSHGEVEEAEAWGLIEFGMPMQIVIENPDFYNKMLEQHTRIGKGYFAKIYEEMFKTEDGQKKFKEDFINSGIYAKIACSRVLDIYNHSQVDEGAIKDLKVLKDMGIRIFDGFSNYDFYSPGRLPDPDSRKEDAKKITKELIENKIFDSAEYTKIVQDVIDKISNHERFDKEIELNIITAAQESGIDPEPDSSEAVKYWDEISKKTGRNILEVFDSRHSGGDMEENMDLLDFSQETVMRLFSSACVDNIAKMSMGRFRNPKLLDALKRPEFQNIILETVSRQVEKNGQDSSGDPKEVPEILLVLMKDRQVIEDMQKRKVFDNYPLCKQISVIDAIANGNFTEQERLKYYMPSEYLVQSNFDENGEPNINFYAAMTDYWGGGGADDKANRKAFRDLLDPEEKTNLSKIQRLSEHLQAFMADADGRGKAILSDLNNGATSYDLETVLKYFDENGPKQELLRYCFQRKEYLLVSEQSDETIAKMGLNEVEVTFLNLYRDKKFQSSNIVRNILPDDISKYFDEDGPKPVFWLDSFNKKDFDFIAKQDAEIRNSLPFNEKQNEAIDCYEKIDEGDVKNLYKNYIVKNLENTNKETIPEIADALNELIYSNAEEISSHPSDFAEAILENTSSEQVKEKLQEIEAVFVKNNIPYVGKVFRTFRILYPVGKDHKATPVMERGALKGRIEAPANPDSPPKTISELKQLVESKDSILFTNLLKASLGSNNRDLRKYLTNLQKGASLTEQVINGADGVSGEDEEILKTYLEHLDTIFNNTQKGKVTPFQKTGNTIEDIRNISKLFTPSERFGVPDRIVQSFGYMLGINTCNEVIKWMDKAVAEADARNRKAALENNFKLESGDLIKSLGVEYLGSSLQNGFLCKEFLNGQTGSDTTPLDSDLNVLPEGLSGNISEGVDKKNAIAAYGNMSCMVVMKGDANSGRSRFVTESEDGTYDSQKYEIWQNSENNYGILVGFPSTEIDYIIHDSRDEEDKYGDLDRMKYEVVKNGFYIPIVDKISGELVFTPDEYDKMRITVLGLQEFTKNDKSRFVAANEPERALVKSLTIPEYSFSDGAKIEGTIDTIDKLQNNKEEVDKKRSAIKNEVLIPILQQFNLGLKEVLDGDLTEGIAEVIDTGSTGRYSNAPGDGDFDFMMKLDKKITKDEGQLEEIRKAFCKKLGLKYSDIIKDGNVRAKNVKLQGLEEPVDIDVTFATKTNKVKYSTDVALKQFYESMTEAQKNNTTANVVFAKRFLKHIKAYKPDRGDTPQGGLGGVGIENWVIQNGGSFVVAAESFMKVANECGDNFEKFKANYSLIDFGENHQGGKNDNFVTRNMSKEGYDKMRTALGEFLEKQKIG